MMDFVLDEASVQATADHLEQTRLNILAGIRFGMMEGMQGLAQTVAEKLHGDPIGERTGNLLSAVLNSPRVVETDGYIKGEVSTASAQFRNLGLWLEFGTKPAIKGKGIAKYPKQFMAGRFASATSSSAAANGHGAFRIEPHPFFNPSFQSYYPTILDTINVRIAEACDA